MMEQTQDSKQEKQEPKQETEDLNREFYVAHTGDNAVDFVRLFLEQIERKRVLKSIQEKIKNIKDIVENQAERTIKLKERTTKLSSLQSSIPNNNNGLDQAAIDKRALMQQEASLIQQEITALNEENTIASQSKGKIEALRASIVKVDNLKLKHDVELNTTYKSQVVALDFINKYNINISLIDTTNTAINRISSNTTTSVINPILIVPINREADFLALDEWFIKAVNKAITDSKEKLVVIILTIGIDKQITDKAKELCAKLSFYHMVIADLKPTLVYSAIYDATCNVGRNKKLNSNSVTTNVNIGNKPLESGSKTKSDFSPSKVAEFHESPSSAFRKTRSVDLTPSPKTEAFKNPSPQQDLHISIVNTWIYGADIAEVYFKKKYITPNTKAVSVALQISEQKYNIDLDICDPDKLIKPILEHPNPTLNSMVIIPISKEEDLKIMLEKKLFEDIKVNLKDRKVLPVILFINTEDKNSKQLKETVEKVNKAYSFRLVSIAKKEYAKKLGEVMDTLITEFIKNTKQSKIEAKTPLDSTQNSQEVMLHTVSLEAPKSSSIYPKNQEKATNKNDYELYLVNAAKGSQAIETKYFETVISSNKKYKIGFHNTKSDDLITQIFEGRVSNLCSKNSIIIMLINNTEQLESLKKLFKEINKNFNEQVIPIILVISNDTILTKKARKLSKRYAFRYKHLAEEFEQKTLEQMLNHIVSNFERYKTERKTAIEEKDQLESSSELSKSRASSTNATKSKSMILGNERAAQPISKQPNFLQRWFGRKSTSNEKLKEEASTPLITQDDSSIKPELKETKQMRKKTLERSATVKPDTSSPISNKSPKYNLVDEAEKQKKEQRLATNNNNALPKQEKAEKPPMLGTRPKPASLADYQKYFKEQQELLNNKLKMKENGFRDSIRLEEEEEKSKGKTPDFTGK